MRDARGFTSDFGALRRALPTFPSELGMGAIRDVLLHTFASANVAYGAVFLLEILAFSIATLMLPRFSQEKFEQESKVSLERVLAVAAD
jgi:hypothetical protein